MRAKADLVIHPVRLRIAGAVVARPMTTRQIAAALPDVPAATLYRHVRVLARYGILDVLRRRTINGIVEPTYTVRRGAVRFGPEEFAAIPPRDHTRYVRVLAGTQMVDAQGYFGQPAYDVVRDGATYFRADLHLSDRESRVLRRELLALTARYRRPANARRRVRHLAVSLLPAPRPTEHD